MAAKNTKKVFSAELKMLKAKGLNGKDLPEYAPEYADVPSAGNVSNEEILQAIGDLTALLGDVATDRPASPDERDDKMLREAKMASDLKNEVRAMSRSIEETKSEIRAMRVGTKGGDKFLNASSELDAVVMATEEATNTILESSERIDQLAEKLKLKAKSDDERLATDEIMETTIRILEACNFQDITGQRITKVVQTLQYVEDRINSMVEIWGEEDINKIESAVVEGDDSEADLLNGPALGDTGVSQDDIDALFD